MNMEEEPGADAIRKAAELQKDERVRVVVKANLWVHPGKSPIEEVVTRMITDGMLTRIWRGQRKPEMVELKANREDRGEPREIERNGEKATLRAFRPLLKAGSKKAMSAEEAKEEEIREFEVRTEKGDSGSGKRKFERTESPAVEVRMGRRRDTEEMEMKMVHCCRVQYTEVKGVNAGEGRRDGGSSKAP